MKNRNTLFTATLFALAFAFAPVVQAAAPPWWPHCNKPDGDTTVSTARSTRDAHQHSVEHERSKWYYLSWRFIDAKVIRRSSYPQESAIVSLVSRGTRCQEVSASSELGASLQVTSSPMSPERQPSRELGSFR